MNPSTEYDIQKDWQPLYNRLLSEFGYGEIDAGRIIQKVSRETAVIHKEASQQYIDIVQKVERGFNFIL